MLAVQLVERVEMQRAEVIARPVNRLPRCAVELLGTIRIDHLGEVFIAKPGESDWTEIEVDLGASIPGIADTGFARGFMAIAPVLIDAIRNGVCEIEHAATFEDGVKVQKVLDAARESDAAGRVINL